MSGLASEVVVYDLAALCRFTKSCALARAIQEQTRVEWKTYRDSKVINGIYFALFWKEPPGTAEIVQAPWREIEAKADAYQLHYLMTWLDKVATRGPSAGIAYMDHLAELRENCRTFTQQTFDDVREINAEVVARTGEAIKTLGQIRLAAQVGVAVMGAAASLAFVGAAAAGAAGAGGAGATVAVLGMPAGAGAGTFAGVGLANSITHTVIKEWEKSGQAKAVAIAIEVGKAAASEGAGNKAQATMTAALVAMGTSQKTLETVTAEIRRLSVRLAPKGFREKTRQAAAARIGKLQGQAGGAKAAMASAGKTARVAGSVARTVPVVFAALDIWGAVSDYNELVEGL